MKLELKHLAPYLPYGLRIKYWDRNIIMNAGSGSSTNWIGITALLQRQNKIECLPILRPLSDLTKEIEVGGEEFVPINILSEFTSLELNYEGVLFEAHEDGEMHETEILHLSYFQIQKLYEWHFDIHNLINEGLAININTLQTELT